MIGKRYERGVKVGRDTLGTAFQGHDHETDRPVLLHYLEQSASDAVLQNLVQLDRSSRWAELPGAAALLGYTRDPTGDRAVLVREPIAGRPLTTTFAGPPIPPGQALWLGERLLSVLQPLHEAGRVHGSICPEVVWVEPTKWNLRLVQPLPGRVDVAAPPRTDDPLAYIACELIADATNPRPESDLYSVAALLFRALAGRTHLRGKTTIARLQSIRAGDYLRLRDEAPDVSAELAAAIESALVPDPQQRPRTALDLRHALADLRGHPPVP